MNECDLYRQISKATGESMRTIAALGFTSLEPLPREHALDRERTISLMPSRADVPAVA